jgi:hypothetical protein
MPARTLESNRHWHHRSRIRWGLGPNSKLDDILYNKYDETSLIPNSTWQELASLSSLWQPRVALMEYRGLPAGEPQLAKFRLGVHLGADKATAYSGPVRARLHV